MANIGANYLQVVAKDTLKNQVGFGICMPRFGYHCDIMGAHAQKKNKAVFIPTCNLKQDSWSFSS